MIELVICLALITIPIIVQPSHFPSVQPLCQSPLSLLVRVPSSSTLLAVGPLSFVFLPVCPFKYSLALLLIFDVVADVLFAVGPLEGAFAVHFVVDPVALVASTIGPLVGCLLYTSDAADDSLRVDLGGRRIIKKKKKK
eukprot:TRINITY_DN1563_c0_g5_i2.p3 TRINITY_DN1563_c0_g5~~TRINITY_DN1563_c0_g5_i2.p3  ORF type:complete len:139 (-),score=1.73 TRINITY_DN1563_c0_g5_i2:5-421(-)